MSKIYIFFKSGFKFLVAAAVLFGAVTGFKWYVDDLVEKKLTDQETLEKISAKIKPTLIFDSDKKILYGKDVMQNLVQDFDIQKDKVGNSVKIIITTKYLITTPPFLQCIDDYYQITVQKGEKFDWEYTLKAIPVLTFGAPPSNGVSTFSLEFIE